MKGIREPLKVWIKGRRRCNYSITAGKKEEKKSQGSCRATLL